MAYHLGLRGASQFPIGKSIPPHVPIGHRERKSMVYFTRTAMDVSIALSNMFLCTFPPHYGYQIPMGFSTSAGAIRNHTLCFVSRLYAVLYRPSFVLTPCHSATLLHTISSSRPLHYHPKSAFACPPRRCLRRLFVGTQNLSYA